jgi:hypothetical protein
MSNTINQASFTVKQYSILELINMATALTGEQAPINQKSVDSILDSFIDTELLEPLHVTTLHGTEYMTSGRHRTASLAIEYADNLSYLVTCLVFTASTPEELLARIKSPNMSRKMSSVENKQLDTACKFGFSSLSVEGLCLSAITAQDKYEPFTLALAMCLKRTDFTVSNLTDVGALKVAQSIVTQLKKIKRVVEVSAVLDTDGTVLSPATKTSFKVLDDTLAGKSDDVVAFMAGQYSEEGLLEIADSIDCDATVDAIRATLIRDELVSLLDDVVNTVLYVQSATLTVPAKVYLTGKLKGVLTSEASEVLTPDSISYRTVLGMPTDWQRKAAPWAQVFAVALTEALS